MKTLHYSIIIIFLIGLISTHSVNGVLVDNTFIGSYAVKDDLALINNQTYYISKPYDSYDSNQTIIFHNVVFAMPTAFTSPPDPSGMVFSLVKFPDGSTEKLGVGVPTASTLTTLSIHANPQAAFTRFTNNTFVFLVSHDLGLSFPLEQFKSGIAANDVKCEQGLQLVIKAEDGSPACVKPDTALSLVKRGWALPGPKDFGYNPGRGPVTLEKQAPAKFSSLGPDPFSPSTLNRLVFFIKSNSTAQIYVQYTSDFENTGNVTTGGQGYTGNPDHFIPLNSSQITISSSPDHVSMSQGTNTTVVYDISTKNVPSGLYWVYLTPICGAMPVAIDMDSSQIIPSDIPVYAEHCGVEVLNYKILGISGGTAEYKLSQELQ